jgi:two-component system nitrogen regulation sensor histidine kinase NtrY
MGFDLINKKKMLTPYFTTKKNGTGLGLAIVGKIINDHNSVIKFKSNNENGAKVEIIIPKFYEQ